jgi:hypothetical protein
MGSQQVIQPDGQIHQLVKGDGGIPAGQLSSDVLAQAASVVVNEGPVTVVVDEGPVIPSLSCSQGPEFQRKLLCAPRPLPQMEKPFPLRSPFRWMVEDCLEAAMLV